MTRVKMNAKHEYEYLANFKVLQNAFKVKKIDKVRVQCDRIAHPIAMLNAHDAQPIQVDKLVKCKMQYVLHMGHSTPHLRALLNLPPSPRIQGQPRVPAVDEAILGPELWGERV